MPFYDDAELLHTLREGELLPAYLIYGKETYLAEVCLQRILEKAVKKGTENFNLRRFDGASLDMTAVRSEAESLPLMAAYKCVVVHNPNLEKLSKSDSDTLQQILADPNPSTVLVLFVTAFDLNPKKSAKLQKLMDQVARVGAVVACQPKTRSDLTRLLRQKFQKAGCEMSSYTAGAMVDRCGMALKTLMAESDKLIAYRQSGEITLADVEAVTHKSLDASIYDLSRAMLQKGRTKAFCPAAGADRHPFGNQQRFCRPLPRESRAAGRKRCEGPAGAVPLPRQGILSEKRLPGCGPLFRPHPAGLFGDAGGRRPGAEVQPG